MHFSTCLPESRRLSAQKKSEILCVCVINLLLHLFPYGIANSINILLEFHCSAGLHILSRSSWRNWRNALSINLYAGNFYQHWFAARHWVNPNAWGLGKGGNLYRILSIITLHTSTTHFSSPQWFVISLVSATVLQNKPVLLPLLRSLGWHSQTHLIACIVKRWSSIPQQAVMATNLDGVKGRLDKFMEERAARHAGYALPLQIEAAMLLSTSSWKAQVGRVLMCLGPACRLPTSIRLATVENRMLN